MICSGLKQAKIRDGHSSAWAILSSILIIFRSCRISVLSLIHISSVSVAYGNSAKQLANKHTWGRYLTEWEGNKEIELLGNLSNSIQNYGGSSKIARGRLTRIAGGGSDVLIVRR